MTEAAPLRSVLYPYRGMEAQLGAYAHDYEKILAERAVQNTPGLDWTILRLPKVYGLEDNGDLSTVYGFASVPDWSWTHGHVENVAAAIVKAALHPNARNAIFNVGEEVTPTMGERLALLPHRDGEPADPPPFDYSQPFVYMRNVNTGLATAFRFRQFYGVQVRARLHDVARFPSLIQLICGRCSRQQHQYPTSGGQGLRKTGPSSTNGE